MYNLGIIGSGPAGYTAAIRASQYGLKVVLFEQDEIGGTCLNKGCIPTKAMLHSSGLFASFKNASRFGISFDNLDFDYSVMNERKNKIVAKIRKSLTQLLASYGVEIVKDKATILESGEISTSSSVYVCENIILATGSVPNKLSFKGDYKDSFLLSSDDILDLKELPESILIVGSGAIGVEWTRIFSDLGVNVSVLEIAEHLIPNADVDVAQRIERIFKRNKIKFYTGVSIDKIVDNVVYLSNGEIIEPQKILLATGRKALIDDSLKSVNKIESDRFILTNSNFKTSNPKIYAIGDVNGFSMLAHSAAHQALELVEYLVNSKSVKFSSDNVPSVIYGCPEIAWVGKTEQYLIENNIRFEKSIFPIAALGKANTDDKIEGFIKILVAEDKILGVHIISEEASSILETAVIAMDNNISPADLLHSIYPHPTYNEGLSEALMGLYSKAISLPPVK